MPKLAVVVAEVARGLALAHPVVDLAADDERLLVVLDRLLVLPDRLVGDADATQQRASLP